MNFNKYLGLSNINNFNIIAQDIQKHYKVNGTPSPYSCNLELLSYNTDGKYFNNSHKLLRLIKKKYRLGYSGFIFKALIKTNKNKKYYKNIFIKEIPIYPSNINYYGTGKNTLSNNDYKIYY